ncbi:MAG: hypothetical protein P4M12_04870 [Gammaproteobacteria bacterium]|nr:hypothetical protein [Gammaproteobacteria bacterium]
MHSHSSNLESELSTWQIYQGPRNKRLATQHLEYLIYALMDGTTRPKLDVISATITIDGIQFNLKNILKAEPDFEHLSFHRLQLSAFGHDNSLNTYPDPLGILHPVEKYAIGYWSGGGYIDFNTLLRFHTLTTESYLDLAHICFATHGLNKINTHEIIKGYRHEHPGAFLRERKRLAASKQLIRHKGFTAISVDSLHSFGDVKTTLPENNFLAKSIIPYANSRSENEYLFPPNTEFAFIKEDEDNWQALALRSINYENSYHYDQAFTPAQLKKIIFHREKLRLNTLAHYLQQHHNEFGVAIKDVIGLIDNIQCEQKTSLQHTLKIIASLQDLLDSMDDSLTSGAKSKLKLPQEFALQILEQLQSLHKPVPKPPLTLFAKRKSHRLENAKTGNPIMEQNKRIKL